MFKKLAIGISCILAVTAGALSAGCGGPADYDKLYADKVKVVYELEGGYYGKVTIRPQNVKHYYDYVEGLKITAPSKDVMRDGDYTFEGWYTGTADEDGQVSYGEKWNFETDTVPREGITLYAKWKAPLKYAYEFVYIDENDEEQSLHTSTVNAGNALGNVLSDVLDGAVLKWIPAPSGYTAVGVYYDKDFSQEFDDSIVPVERGEAGEELGDTVKLYVKLIEGDYTVVRSAAELTAAIKTPKDIYLFNDIDLKGAAFNFYEFINFNNKTLLGNGKKIHNFTIKYSDVNSARLEDFESESRNKNTALHISLFGDVRNTTVKDVSFEDVTVTVTTGNKSVTKIYVAPLAVSATNSNFENVTVKAAFGYGTFPNGFGANFTFDAENGRYADENSKVIFVTEHGVYKNENSTETNCNFADVTFTVKTEE